MIDIAFGVVFVAIFFVLALHLFGGHPWAVAAIEAGAFPLGWIAAGAWLR